MICPRCQTDNKPKAKYCQRCGRDFTKEERQAAKKGVASPPPPPPPTAPPVYQQSPQQPQYTPQQPQYAPPPQYPPQQVYIQQPYVKPKKPWYKRVWVWLLIIFIGFPTLYGILTKDEKSENVSATASLSSAAEPSSKINNVEKIETNEANSAEEFKEQILYEKDNVRITLKGVKLGGIFGDELLVFVENDGDKSITIQTRDESVNGIMVSTMFSCEVGAGKKANDDITLMRSDMRIADIKTLMDIEFKFHIFDTETWDNAVDSDTIKIALNENSGYIQTYDDSGEVVLDQNGIKIVAKKLDSEESFWGADLFLYVENNSGTDITVQVRDTSINGFMVNPMFSCDVLDGKKAFDSITFLSSDLENNGITDITEFEFTFHVFESKNWQAMFDSDKIAVKFPEK